MPYTIHVYGVSWLTYQKLPGVSWELTQWKKKYADWVTDVSDDDTTVYSGKF